MKDQYMAGDNLLVAPMFTGQTSRKVILPAGKWFDFYTGKYVGNGEGISVTPGLETIPVFVKDGGIVPMMPALLQAPKAGEKVNLEIRYYGYKNGSYQLYDDDGETFNYEHGDYSFRTISIRRKNDKIKGSISRAKKDKPNSYAKITYKMMTK